MQNRLQRDRKSCLPFRIVKSQCDNASFRLQYNGSAIHLRRTFIVVCTAQTSSGTSNCPIKDDCLLSGNQTKQDYKAVPLATLKPTPAPTDKLDLKLGRMTSQVSREAEDLPLLFVSLGTTVIDEIHFSGGRVIEDVPGGSGIYGMLFLS